MIFLFHCLSLVANYLIREKERKNALKYFKEIQEELQLATKARAFATRDSENDLKFDPPVFRQRYDVVYNVLLNEKWRKDIKKIVEFGCAELNLYMYLKSLKSLNEICFVDIDEELLNDNLYRLRPLTIEFLRRRSEPFYSKVFVGSIADPDHRILDSDAVIGIEIIEHLYPDVLEAVPFTIFHCIRPKIAIFTTPNADFNVLFLKDRKFRHADHKFEWTRDQFESWAHNITARFPSYSVIFQGIGCGPRGTEDLGCCSQMAIFFRLDIINTSFNLPQIRCLCSGDMQCCDASPRTPRCSNCYLTESFGICKYFSYTQHFLEMEYINKKNGPPERDPRNLVFYKLLETIEYPYEIDHRTPEEKFLEEVKWKIINSGTPYGRYFKEDHLRSEIPVEELTYNSEGKFINACELGKLLKTNGYRVEVCAVENGPSEPCVIYEPTMDDTGASSSGESAEAEGYESGHSRFFTDVEDDVTDWDTWDVPTEPAGLPWEVPLKGNAEQNDDFPDWLLQILGANIINEEDNNAQDEAHFYCQGDGLGVHPSVLTAGADDDNIDDDDDDDTSTSTSSLTSSLTSPSTRGTANIAETGVENSELDALSIPFDNPSSMATENDRNVIHDNSSGEEESSEKQLTLSDIIVTNFLSAHSDSNNSQNTVVDMSSLSSYAVKPQQLTLADSEEYFDSNDDVS